MLKVTDFREGINQGALLLVLECIVEVKSTSTLHSSPSELSCRQVACQVCMTCISSQGARSVTKLTRSTAVREENTENQ